MKMSFTIDGIPATEAEVNLFIRERLKTKQQCEEIRSRIQCILEVNPIEAITLHGTMRRMERELSTNAILCDLADECRRIADLYEPINPPSYLSRKLKTTL